MAQRISLGIAIVIFVAGIVFAGLGNVGLAMTNETEFCTSCHSTKVNLNELQETIHWKSPWGVRAGCSDCHVPKPFIPKMIAKVMAAKDVYHEIMGTIDDMEKYEQHRWGMANRVWYKMKSTDSRECRSCHSWDAMDLAEQDRSARKRHGRARDEGKTCIDCHKGIAHHLPEGYVPDTPGEEE